MENFKVIKKFIREDICRQMSKQMFDAEKNGYNLNQNDIQCQKSSSFYGLFNDIQALCQKKLEIEIGEELLPTYNYCRIYKKGETLEKHVDRESCEISITVTLDYPLSPWSFWARESDNNIEMSLVKGDACIYKGCEVLHWRDELTHQSWQTQAFFHYVLKNGPNAAHAYDSIVNGKNK
jgi:hypothetical protein